MFFLLSICAVLCTCFNWNCIYEFAFLNHIGRISVRENICIHSYLIYVGLSDSTCKLYCIQGKLMTWSSNFRLYSLLWELPFFPSLIIFIRTEWGLMILQTVCTLYKFYVVPRLPELTCIFTLYSFFYFQNKICMKGLDFFL